MKPEMPEQKFWLAWSNQVPAPKKVTPPNALYKSHSALQVVGFELVAQLKAGVARAPPAAAANSNSACSTPPLRLRAITATRGGARV